MSTRDRGIPLYNTPDNVGYRLLELPPDLEKLLESDDPPPMTLQSTDTAAVLSTPGKLYSLRQKGTSNALILLRPHQPDAASPEQGMAVVSEIREFVELEPVEGGEKFSEKASVARGKWHERFGKTR